MSCGYRGESTYHYHQEKHTEIFRDGEALLTTSYPNNDDDDTSNSKRTRNLICQNIDCRKWAKSFFVLFLKFLYKSKIIHRIKSKMEKDNWIGNDLILIWMVVTCRHFFELYMVIKKFFLIS